MRVLLLFLLLLVACSHQGLDEQDVKIIETDNITEQAQEPDLNFMDESDYIEIGEMV